MAAVDSLPWASDRDELDVERVKRLVLRYSVPGADPDDIAIVGGGWDNDVWRAGDLYLRFPRRHEVVARDRREMNFLNQLQPSFPFDVPRETTERPADDLFPYPWFTFLPVEGIRWDRADYDAGELELLSRDIAEALTALHGFEIRHARKLGFEDNRETPAIWMDGLRTQRRTLQRVLPRSTMKRWLPFLAGDFVVPGCPDAVRVIHNDMGGAHVRVDQTSKRLVGLIDFGDVTIGDPCIDLVGFFVERGMDFVDEIVARYAYDLPDDWPRRVAYYGRILALKWVAESALMGDRELLPKLEWFHDRFEPLLDDWQ